MKKYYIVISSHVVFDNDGKDIYGPAHNVSSYLDIKKINHSFIKHPLNKGHDIVIEEHKNGNRISKKIKTSPNLPFLICLIKESIVTLRHLKQKKPEIYIGVDPFNAILGVIAKKIHCTKKTIFYTPDYTPKRFKNKTLNYLYHRIDKFSAMYSDQIWNVSTRIQQIRKKQGIADNKNFLVPNSPSFDESRILPYDQINKHDLVIVGNVTKTLDYEIIIDAIEALVKKFPDIRLLVIGIGDYMNDLKKIVESKKLEKNILFMGHKNHDELLKILSKSVIGLALYTKEYEWNYFGDSMKAREYLACGLPVIISDVPSTSDDIKKYKAGFVINNENTEIIQIIEKLFLNSNLYLEMRNNAIKLAQKYDSHKILDKILYR
jgi:glycosyltransferase involved in cell wall biosynthesis